MTTNTENYFYSNEEKIVDVDNLNKSINIDISSSTKAIAISTIDGRLVLEQRVNVKHSSKITINSLSAGIYVLQVININDASRTEVFIMR